MGWAIETFNLTKLFMPSEGLYLRPFCKRDAVLAINNINLSIKKGELFCLIGPNGSGKTTLIKILCSLILPTKGTAFINGVDILGNNEKLKSSIGLMTSDDRSFYWRLTGRQNLTFFAFLYNLNPQQATKKIKEIMELLEIEAPDKRFQEYSTGMKQRLGIARSLLNDPQVLFMDEPTKSLDPKASYNLKVFIKERLVREQGKTVLFTTHHLDETEEFADRLAIIDRGRLVACGNLGELQHLIGEPAANLEKIFVQLTKTQ